MAINVKTDLGQKMAINIQRDISHRKGRLAEIFNKSMDFSTLH